MDGYARKVTSRNVKVTAAVIVRYDMINVGKKLNQHMGDREYRAQTLSLLRKSEGRPLRLVTGVMTCKNTVVTLDKKAERGIGAGSVYPLGNPWGAQVLVTPRLHLST